MKEIVPEQVTSSLRSLFSINGPLAYRCFAVLGGQEREDVLRVSLWVLLQGGQGQDQHGLCQFRAMCGHLTA